MTNEELRELYSHCIYCMLDDDTEKELSDWELREMLIGKKEGLKICLRREKRKLNYRKK